MGNLTPAEIWTYVLAVASAIVLLSNAAEKIAKAIQAAKAPNTRQDERLQDLEDRMVDVETKLLKDHARFESLDQGNRVTQRALLALLDHGIDGNNIEQMQHAKEELQNHLINR
jgi:hypothetical protein